MYNVYCNVKFDVTRHIDADSTSRLQILCAIMKLHATICLIVSLTSYRWYVGDFTDLKASQVMASAQRSGLLLQHVEIWRDGLQYDHVRIQYDCMDSIYLLPHYIGHVGLHDLHKLIILQNCVSSMSS